MTTYYRFHDLVARGYVNNRMTLKRRIDAGLIPRPVDLGPNTRAWTDEQLAEIDARIAAGEFRTATEQKEEPQTESPPVTSVEQPAKKRRGRPPDSRNKPKPAPQECMAAAE
jgi:hypothetical protein